MVIVTDSENFEAKVETITVDGEPAKAFHTTVYKWSPSVYKEIAKTWKKIREEDSDTFYAIPPDEKVAKFAMTFGFKPYCDVELTDGNVTTMYIHEVVNG